MSRGYSKYPILRMPLDLSQGVDKEVFDIVAGFKSGVDAKNFLCSAVLYYARSPLVLSANALQERLEELSGLIKKLDFSYPGLLLEKILAKLDEVSMVRVDSTNVVESCVSSVVMDANTHSVLSSLKEKFKV